MFQQIDEQYIGKKPAVQVSIFNLNDNVNEKYLSDLLKKKYGEFHELKIFFHPQTSKHLGLAKVTFSSISSAKSCVTGLNGTSIMGNVLEVIYDPSGMFV